MGARICWRETTVWLLLMAVIVVIGIIGVLPSLARWNDSYDEALSFACGYRQGQIAIMGRLPALFPVVDKTETPNCPRMRANAVARGFTTAADD